MASILLELLGVFVRWALNAAGLWLVARHVMTGSQADHFTTELTNHIVLAAPMAASLVWSIWSRYRGRKRVIAAQQAPAGATSHDLSLRMRWLTWRDVFGR